MYLLPFGPAEETDWLFVSFPLENKVEPNGLLSFFTLAVLFARL